MWWWWRKAHSYCDQGGMLAWPGCLTCDGLRAGCLTSSAAALTLFPRSDPILSNITQLSLSRSLKYKLLLIINIKYYILLETPYFDSAWCLTCLLSAWWWKWPLSIPGIWIFMNNQYSAVKIQSDWRKYSRYFVTGVWGEVCWWHCTVG